MDRLHLAVILVSLLPGAHSYTRTRGSWCSAAPFFPGVNRMGQGYDIAALKRKTAYLIDTHSYIYPGGYCRLYRNPLQRNQLQKIPVSVVGLSAYTRCYNHLYRNLQPSVSKVVGALANQDSYDWKLGLALQKFGNLEVGGTRSAQHSFASAKEKEDKFTFSIHRSTCAVYKYRLKNAPPLSARFKYDVSRLPSSYSAHTKYHYRRLISLYGTHYIREASLGGRFRRLTAVRTCLSSLNGFSYAKAHYCLSLGHLVGLGKTKATASHRSCYNFLQNRDAATSSSSARGMMHVSHTEVVGGSRWSGQFSLLRNDSRGFRAWLQSLPHRPDLVRHSLRLMSDLVPDRRKRSQVKAAIEDYLKESGVRKTSGDQCGTKCCPKKAWSGRLIVTIVRAWNLKGDHWGSTESYAKMWYGSHYRRTRMIRSNNPHWNARYDLGQVDTRHSLKIQVWDDDVWSDDLLGSCAKTLSEGAHRFTCYAKKGGVLVSYSLTCDPHLTGPRCSQYKPISPYPRIQPRA